MATLAAAASTSVKLSSRLVVAREGLRTRAPNASFAGFKLIQTKGIPVASTRKRSLVVKAAQGSPQAEELKAKALDVVDTVKEKWETLDNKPQVILYGSGALLALWLTSTILGAIDSVPLVPGFLKLVGTAYTGWFVYRYVLFEHSRKELGVKVNELLDQIGVSK